MAKRPQSIEEIAARHAEPGVEAAPAAVAPPEGLVLVVTALEACQARALRLDEEAGFLSWANRGQPGCRRTVKEWMAERDKYRAAPIP